MPKLIILTNINFKTAQPAPPLIGCQHIVASSRIINFPLSESLVPCARSTYAIVFVTFRGVKTDQEPFYLRGDIDCRRKPTEDTTHSEHRRLCAQCASYSNLLPSPLLRRAISTRVLTLPQFFPIASPFSSYQRQTPRGLGRGHHNPLRSSKKARK